jgi:hypothetical protein
MNQPQQHYEVTDGDFDFIWKNIDSPLVVRDRINVIKTRSHPYQSERDKVLDILDEWLNSDDHLSLYKWEVREKIRELRQAGEPDA